MKTLVGLLIISSFVVACSGPKPFTLEDMPSSEEVAAVEEIAPEATESALREVTPLWENKISSSKAWSDYVYRQIDTLGPNLTDVIPADYTLFCPKYKKLSDSQRKQYWTFMLSAMARFESNFNTNAKYTEAFNDSSGKKVISRGLLQISIESGNAYGCGFKTAQDLHNPYKNLSCGIRILNRWVGRDKRIAGKTSGTWKGGARYWSVLRSTRTRAYQPILKWSQNLSFCK